MSVSRTHKHAQPVQAKSSGITAGLLLLFFLAFAIVTVYELYHIYLMARTCWESIKEWWAERKARNAELDSTTSSA